MPSDGHKGLAVECKREVDRLRVVPVDNPNQLSLSVDRSCTFPSSDTQANTWLVGSNATGADVPGNRAVRVVPVRSER